MVKFDNVLSTATLALISTALFVPVLAKKVKDDFLDGEDEEPVKPKKPVKKIKPTRVLSSSPERPTSTLSTRISPACFIIHNSEVVPDYNGVATSVSNFYSDTKSFDNYIKTFFFNAAGASGFIHTYDCPGFNGTHVRYTAALRAAYELSSSKSNCDKLPTSPPSAPIVPLCKDTCKIAVRSLINTFNDPAVCDRILTKKVVSARDFVKKFDAFCDTLKINNSSRGKCLDGDSDRTSSNFCGFVNINVAQAHCRRFPNDTCCLKLDLSVANATVTTSVAIKELVNATPTTSVAIKELVNATPTTSVINKEAVNAIKTDIAEENADFVRTMTSVIVEIRKNIMRIVTNFTIMLIVTSSLLLILVGSCIYFIVRHFKRRALENGGQFGHGGDHSRAGSMRSNRAGMGSNVSQRGQPISRQGTHSAMASPAPGSAPGSRSRTPTRGQARPVHSMFVGRRTASIGDGGDAGGANYYPDVDANMLTADGVLVEPGYTLRVCAPYMPAYNDELTLFIGQTLVVDNVFEDGWATGQCLETGIVGAFPIKFAVVDNRYFMSQ